MRKEINYFIFRNKAGVYLGKKSKVTTSPSINDYWLNKPTKGRFNQMRTSLKWEDLYVEKCTFVHKGTYTVKE